MKVVKGQGIFNRLQINARDGGVRTEGKKHPGIIIIQYTSFRIAVSLDGDSQW